MRLEGCRFWMRRHGEERPVGIVFCRHGHDLERRAAEESAVSLELELAQGPDARRRIGKLVGADLTAPRGIVAEVLEADHRGYGGHGDEEPLKIEPLEFRG